MTSLRTGVLLTWDSVTRRNTVNVGGTVMTDLPIVDFGGTVSLTVNDVLVIATEGPTWAIVGKLIMPT